MSADRVALRNMAFFAHLGVTAAEKEVGQKVFMDVEMFTDLQPAGKNDDIHLTVNYELAHSLIKKVIQDNRFNLIEGLAERVAAILLGTFPVHEVLVRVRKPNVPVEGAMDCAEIEIRRKKDA